MLQCFVINLARSLDRRASMEAHIAELFAKEPHLQEKLNFTFFQAITPKDIRESGFITRYCPFWAGVYKARAVRETELACFASHYALWQKCVELGEGIIVLEDDIRFCAGFGEGVLSIAQSPYEYVRLAWRTWHTMYLIQERFALAPKLILGASGYYISPSGAAKLIKSAEKIFVAVDYYMSFSYLHNVAEMLYLPHIAEISELDERSTIGKPEHQPKDKGFYYRFVLLRELHRLYRDVRMRLFAQKSLRACKLLAKGQ
ncbi:glycosyltransferase family 25 protein [Helicobacter canis]|uniref:Lipooligosaccharide 5G8 epitope biosynthesis-protein n=1 Tax=Helicobacter canis TaxID=29419 RepID=A0A377J1L2_9HELI|nr:glycosyltransferase family 25 protein [Helicobacter canis]STO96382.1 lipooligosaccharide 5G8 epitope biosynthesis-protein [Helicobacter canis]